MEYRNQKSMSRWQASLISGLVIAAGFYASADLEKRNNKLVRANVTLKTTKQNYAIIGDSSTKLADSVITNEGSIVFK